MDRLPLAVDPPGKHTGGTGQASVVARPVETPRQHVMHTPERSALESRWGKQGHDSGPLRLESSSGILRGDLSTPGGLWPKTRAAGVIRPTDTPNCTPERRSLHAESVPGIESRADGTFSWPPLSSETPLSEAPELCPSPEANQDRISTRAAHSGDCRLARYCYRTFTDP